MHRDFWKSDRISCEIYGQDVSLTISMTVVLDIRRRLDIAEPIPDYEETMLLGR
jgi:hypothetical protein